MDTTANRFARYSTIFFSQLALVILNIMDLNLPFITPILFSIVGIAGVYLASERRLDFIITIVLGMPWLFITWGIHITGDKGGANLVELILVMMFFAFVTYLVVRHLFQAQNVGPDLLFGAGAAYLMLGLFFAFIFRMIMYLNPDCISFPEGGGNFSSVLYFSFTTLTTLGYGDILPVTPVVRSMAILEATMGVLFTTILVGRLLGLYLKDFAQND